jgi:hypothetical protein
VKVRLASIDLASKVLSSREAELLIPFYREADVEQRIQHIGAALNELGQLAGAVREAIARLQASVPLTGIPDASLRLLQQKLDTASREIQFLSLDTAEVDLLDRFIRRINQRLATLAARNGYAYVDGYGEFRSYAVADSAGRTGRPLLDRQNQEVCRLQATWPLPGQAPDGKGCGIFSLDGFHPNQLGHAVFANTLIDALNRYYGLQIPLTDVRAAWQADGLNQSPVDLSRYLRRALVQCTLLPLDCDVNALNALDGEAWMGTAVSALFKGAIGWRGVMRLDPNWRANKAYRQPAALPAN